MLDANGNGGIAMTTVDCFPHTFGFGACSSTGDLLADENLAIKPMGQDDENLCFFKKYSGYNNGDEIWIKACDATNANPTKAGKYQFTYDVTTKRITSEGSRLKDADNLFCLRITNPEMRYKQRVRIAPCNPNDQNQLFDIEDGRIYSSVNHRICAGYQYYKLRDDGATRGTALMFNTCYPNNWAVTDENFEN